jgi:putative ABC transport system ATP-binding protein
MSAENRRIVTLENVGKIYRTDHIETHALQDIDLEVSAGEFITVMGPSGCGKSTLLNLIGLLDAPGSGKVLLDGKDVSSLPDRKTAGLRNSKIGFIFQSFQLINDLNVLRNVEIPLLYRRMSARERYRLSTEALVRVGLGSRVKHRPNQLSGGQQQRVAIARAIVGKPDLLLADEPTGNLDSYMGNEIMEILLRLNRESGTTIIMVSHDPLLAKKTDRIIRLFDGRLVLKEHQDAA